MLTDVVPVARRRTRSWITVPRVTGLLVVGFLALILVRPLAGNVFAAAYVALVLATAVVLRGLRREPGTWLGRRPVRRALVIGLVATCAGFIALPTASSLGGGAASAALLLFMLLILLNVTLGRATRRMATAVDGRVDEREEQLRNRAHHIAYWILGVTLASVVLLSTLAGTDARAWQSSLMRGAGGSSSSRCSSSCRR